MFCDVVLLLVMLLSASSILEIHMLVAVFVMLNILELIMEIMPNYLTRLSLSLSLFTPGS